MEGKVGSRSFWKFRKRNNLFIITETTFPRTFSVDHDVDPKGSVQIHKIYGDNREESVSSTEDRSLQGTGVF
jgi:hypothetical protein